MQIKCCSTSKHFNSGFLIGQYHDKPDINITRSQFTRLHCFKLLLVLRCVQLETVPLFPTLIMYIQILLQNLHEEVSCSVCMTKFTDPKQLPCLHSFCLHCLQRIQRTSGIRETISCPECRQNFRIPGDGDLNTLPTNVRINSLLDVLAIKEYNTSGVKCGNCDRKRGESSYCFQCCSFWCDDCISLHNGIKANKEHHALALKDRDFENILNWPAFCGEPGHEKKELEFFCKSCKVAICYSCVATLHDGHPKILLDEAANERKMQVKSAIDSQKQKVLKKRKKIAKIQSNRVKIQAQVESVKQNAQTFADKMIAVIEAKKQEIFDGAEKKGKEFVERLEVQQREEENKVKLIEAAIEEREALVKRSTNADIVRLNTIFQEEFDEHEEEVDYDLESLHHFIFKENESLMHKANSEGTGSFETFLSETIAKQSRVEGKANIEVTVGLEAQIAVTTRNAQEEQCYEERDCVTAEIRNRQGHDCATKTQVRDNKDGTYKISFFAKEIGTCQAAVKVNGEHVRGSHHLQNSFHLPGTLTSPTNFINSAMTNDKTIFDNHIHFSDILKLTTYILNLFPNHLHFTSTGTKTIIHHLTYTTGYKPTINLHTRTTTYCPLHSIKIIFTVLTPRSLTQKA